MDIRIGYSYPPSPVPGLLGILEKTKGNRRGETKVSELRKSWCLAIPWAVAMLGP